MSLRHGNWKCTHSAAFSCPHYSIHGKKLGEALWCPLCEGWVDRMENNGSPKPAGHKP